MITSRLKLLLDAYIEIMEILAKTHHSSTYTRAAIEKELGFIQGLIQKEVNQ